MNCPVCRKNRDGLPECPRCGFSYSPLDRIRECAEIQLAKAGAAMRKGDFEKMLYHARRAQNLQKSEPASTAVIIAAVAVGRYEEALREAESLNSQP